MDTYYHVARRIWRIIYPPLIFMAISIFIAVVITVTFLFSDIMRESFRGINFLEPGFNAESFDPSANVDEIVDNSVRNLLRYSLHISLCSNIVCLAVFLPMWFKTKKKNHLYKNKMPVIGGLLALGLFASFNILQMLVFSLTDITRFFPGYGEVVDYLVADTLIIQILAVGIAAPVVEELVFRGILMNRMNWLPVWASVLIQAVCSVLCILICSRVCIPLSPGRCLGWCS